MKIAMINGSPKKSESTSAALLNDLKICFLEEATFIDYHFTTSVLEPEMIQSLKDVDAIVFAFPLYVDGIPSHLLSCLCQIEKEGIGNKKIHVYGIANSGFFEGKQNVNALAILENWCDKTELVWGQGIGIGGGGALSGLKNVPVGKGPKKNLGYAVNELATNILACASAPNCYLSINFPRFLYKWAAQISWRQGVKSNGLKIKDLSKRF